MESLKEHTLNSGIDIRYIIDLTRSYHNQLQKEEKKSTQIYLWNRNVTGVAEDGNVCERYYFQDEIGSLIRLMNKNRKMAE